MRKRKDYIKHCQVSEMKTYCLNGYHQKVLFEGEHRNSPIIIYLHGGPGSPIPFCAGSRGLFPEITKDFIMVYWDQLGCGINDYPIDDTFSIDHYIAMTVDLIKAVHRDFPDCAINLFGVSWGSILAANAVVQIPELIHRVVVYGQVTKELFFNQEVFEALDSAKLSKKEKAEFAELQSNSAAVSREPDSVRIMVNLIRKHTEGYQAKNGGKTPMGKIILGLLTSPDYTLKDFKAVIVNGTQKNRSLLKELIRLDLSKLFERIPIPYLIMQGDTDIVTSTKSVEALVKNSGNRNLSFCRVPNSGHMPSGNGMTYIIQKGFDFLKE